MKIIVYSTPQCPWCIKAKELLKSKGVKFTEKDVTDQDAMAEMLKKTGGEMGVPVLDIDGKIIQGYDEKKILRAIGK